MTALPTTPHDWTVWLFEQLQGVSALGDLYEGTLPPEFDFDGIVGRIPQQLLGVTDATRRVIEFSPAAGNNFDSLAQLVGGPRLLSVAPVFTVRELKYTHLKCAPPQAIQNYLGAVKLWALLKAMADHSTDTAAFFIKAFDSKIELRPEYDAADLVPLPGLDAFEADYADSTHHGDQKRNIIRSTLLDMFKGRAVIKMTDVLSRWTDLVQGVRSSYTLLMADFSFERLRTEVEKQNLDDMLRLNKTISEIQNQLLALPAALILAGAGVKAGQWSVNLPILVGMCVFVWMMVQLIRNQRFSVDAIEQEIGQRQAKVKAQPAEIAERVLPSFDGLNLRVKSQKALLRGIGLVIALVGSIALAVIVHAQWPAFFPAAWCWVLTMFARIPGHFVLPATAGVVVWP